MRDNLIAAGMLMLSCSISAADIEAETVSRWVDDNGVTHFTDAQFAPASAKTVAVAPANRMDVPVTPQLATAKPRKRPTFTRINRPPKPNQKGWRPRRESLYTGRKHQRNRRR